MTAQAARTAEPPPPRCGTGCGRGGRHSWHRSPRLNPPPQWGEEENFQARPGEDNSRYRTASHALPLQEPVLRDHCPRSAFAERVVEDLREPALFLQAMYASAGAGCGHPVRLPGGVKVIWLGAVAA